MKKTNEQKHTERLKDRRAYRATLIQRRNDTDTKIAKVEQEIRNLQASNG